MKNLDFNNDGPIFVSPEDFQTYQQLSFPNTDHFDFLFYVWVNENYPDGVRILALRDILRQPTSGTSSHAYYYLHHDFGRILNIGGHDKAKDLYWQLHNRPKLLQEFVQEFRYLLEGVTITLPVSGDASIREKHALLEIVFRLADEQTGQELLPYYDIWDPRYPTMERAAKTVSAWADARNPEWLRKELWKQIEDAIWHELLHFKFKTEDCSVCDLKHYLTYNEMMLQSALEFIARHAFKPESKDLTPVTELFDLMEKYTPNNLCLIPYPVLVPLLYCLPPYTALLYAERYLRSGYCNHIAELNAREARSFVYWLHGITISCYAYDSEEYRKIDAWLKKFMSTIDSSCKC